MGFKRRSNVPRRDGKSKGAAMLISIYTFECTRDDRVYGLIFFSIRSAAHILAKDIMLYFTESSVILLIADVYD